MKNKKLINSFKYAFSGIVTAFKSEKNMKIHFTMMMLVIIFGILLKISLNEWLVCIMLFCMVIGSEMINTAVENVVNLAMPTKNEVAKNAKDISAGAVLVFAIGSAIIGLIIFIPKIINVLVNLYSVMKQISAKYIVDEPNTILKYLLSNVKNKSKNNIKSLLTNECVFVNDKLVTKYDYSLKSNDVIDIKLSQIGNIKDKNKLDILYEDKYLLIVNKPANMLTIGTDKEKNNTLYHYTSNYVKNTNKNNKIFIVNRLDKETSGIVVFAKNENIKRAMQDNWNDIVSLRKYIAITHGITDDKGIIKSYLKENSSHMVYSTNDKNNGKLSITEYKKIKNNKKYSLLEIIIHTGRKNQIRVHMKDINHPIIGDNKYGIKDNFKRMMLHAYQIKFTHPITNKEVNIISRVDQVFDKVI